MNAHDNARLRDFIIEHGLAAKLIAADASMPTVPLAAAALGVPESKVVKTIVFEGKRVTGSTAIAIVTGDTRVDRGRVAALLGLPTLKLAAAETVVRVTGFEIGGVPPVGHVSRVPVVVDRTVIDHDLVYGGGGDEGHMLEITPSDIVRLTNAMVADITLHDGIRSTS